MTQKHSERRQTTLTSEHLRAFLVWLSPQPESQGETYETARRRLIIFFASRKCDEPESLADETLDCAIRKVPEIPAEAQPLAYLIGIAKNIYMDYLRRQKKADALQSTLGQAAPTASCEATFNETKEQRHHCLERCLDELPVTERQMVLTYYSQTKQQKIDLRKQLAEQFGVSVNSLRNRVFRLNQRLAQCVTDCLEKKPFTA